MSDQVVEKKVLVCISGWRRTLYCREVEISYREWVEYQRAVESNKGEDFFRKFGDKWFRGPEVEIDWGEFEGFEDVEAEEVRNHHK